MTYTLFLGSKRYSSWSLRGWLLFASFGVPVQERLAQLRSDDFEALRKEMAPSKTVPTLAHDVGGARRIVWDSLAMAEYLAEQHPEAGYWPSDVEARAWARSVTAEAHSSFGPMRKAMPMNLARRYTQKTPSDDVAADIARMSELWTMTRAKFGAGGPYLFGAGYTVADAFFTPYATRLETYGFMPDGEAGAFAQALLDHPKYLEWRAAGLNEPEEWILAHYEFEDSPGVLG